MGQVSYLPIGMEPQGVDGPGGSSDQKFIKKSDSDAIYDNCPLEDASEIEEQFGKLGNRGSDGAE